ncbi:putative B3 domain-containing protein, partial [Mucuna pruriens]
MRGKDSMFTINGHLGYSTCEKSPQRSSSLNWPKQTRAQEVACSFISYNHFFTVFIKPVHLAENQMPMPDLKGILENKEKYVMLQTGERSWNVKLIPTHNFTHCRFSAGWSLFAREIELQPGDGGFSFQRVITSLLQTAFMAGNAIFPIRFFKIILKTNLERIQIPNKFARKYGGGLPNPVFIKPPDGTEWKVYWTHQNGEIWFEKGWKQFVEHFSLHHGHVIFFTYGGTSQIDVLILDQSALEINYPSCNPCDEEESVIILDEWSDQKAKQMIVSVDLFHLHPIDKKCTERTRSLNQPKQSSAQEVARNFISYNPFFTVIIRSSSLRKGRQNVPSLKGFIENKEKNVTLLLGERSWKVKLLPVYKAFSFRCLSAGWSLFTRESELQAEDVCVFELVNIKDLVFQMHVFKNQVSGTEQNRERQTIYEKKTRVLLFIQIFESRPTRNAICDCKIPKI